MIKGAGGEGRGGCREGRGRKSSTGIASGASVSRYFYPVILVALPKKKKEGKRPGAGLTWYRTGYMGRGRGRGMGMQEGRW